MRKILVVDDDTDILQLLKTYLTWNEYDVRTTTTCSEGMEIFHSFQPELVLLDINVGSEDGRVMCKQIKQQAEFEHIPVILFSANPELLNKAAQYGATATIEKPFNLDEMLALFDKHLMR